MIPELFERSGYLTLRERTSASIWFYFTGLLDGFGLPLFFELFSDEGCDFFVGLAPKIIIDRNGCSLSNSAFSSGVISRSGIFYPLAV